MYTPRGSSLSLWRVRELVAVCRQYDDRRRRAADLLYGTPPAGPGSGAPGDPTAMAVIRRERLLRTNDSIDQAAAAVDQGTAVCRTVCRGGYYPDALRYGYIGSRATFYRARRRFLEELDRIL